MKSRISFICCLAVCLMGSAFVFAQDVPDAPGVNAAEQVETSPLPVDVARPEIDRALFEQRQKILMEKKKAEMVRMKELQKARKAALKKESEKEKARMQEKKEAARKIRELKKKSRDHVKRLKRLQSYRRR